MIDMHHVHQVDKHVYREQCIMFVYHVKIKNNSLLMHSISNRF